MAERGKVFFRVKLEVVFLLALEISHKADRFGVIIGMDIEPSVLTDDDVTGCGPLESIAQSSVGSFALRIGCSHYNSGKFLSTVWIETAIGPVNVDVFGNRIQRFFDFLYGGRIPDSDLVLQFEYLRHVGGPQCT